MSLKNVSRNEQVTSYLYDVTVSEMLTVLLEVSLNFSMPFKRIVKRLHTVIS